MEVSNKDIYTAIWNANNGYPSKAIAFLRSLVKKDASPTSTVGTNKIAVVVGHNSKSKGAYCKGDINQYEYDYNSEVALYMLDIADHLPNIEVKVFHRKYLGKKMYTAEIMEVYKRVNAWNPKATCEIHFNWLNGAGRIEMLHLLNSSESKKLSSILLSKVSKLMDQSGDLKIVARKKNDRGGKSLYYCKSPISMTEPFDCTNDAHRRKIHSVGKKSLAQSYIDSFTTYFDS